MPKTPDVIKKGLEVCNIWMVDEPNHCMECPYFCTKDCADTLMKHAIALIQQLEAELADTKKEVGYTNGLCDICKHKNEHENECEANDFLCYNCPADCACKECYSDASHYEWRGVMKEE